MNNIIKGMDVLKQTPIKDYTTLSYIFAGLGICITIIAIIMLCIKTKSKNHIDFKSQLFKGFLFFYVLGLGMAVFSGIHFPWFYVETGRYIYECELEDNVSANYISENFNVISVEDGIWTIENK